MLSQAMNVFHMHQKATLAVNRYEIFADNGGEPGELVAFVEQKRLALKEQVTVYADVGRSRVLAGFRARKVVDLGSGYDVTDGDGHPVGSFRKDFGKSLANSTWHLHQRGVQVATGRERSAGVALLRRVWDLLPLVDAIPFPFRYHFDFTCDGRPVFAVDKKTWVRDHYLIRIDAPEVDRRLVIAQAIAVDALQSR